MVKEPVEFVTPVTTPEIAAMTAAAGAASSPLNTQTLMSTGCDTSTPESVYSTFTSVDHGHC